jgi:hypothetical protein
MKHIKIYEDYGDDNEPKSIKKYWLLPTDDERFEKSLEEIEYTDFHDNDSFLHIPTLKKNKYVFVFMYQRKPDAGKEWSWNPYFGNQLDDWGQKHGYDFCGNVNIKDYELKASKYNL